MRNKFLLTLLSFFVLTGCTFMYIPLFPANPQEREARFLLAKSEGLSANADGQLSLSVTVEEVPESDWLAVQWFNPIAKEVASDSQWLALESEAQTLVFTMPSRIELNSGYWRAVVSYQGQLIRQFGIDIPAPSNLSGNLSDIPEDSSAGLSENSPENSPEDLPEDLPGN